MLRRNLLGVLSVAALVFSVSTAQEAKKDEPKKGADVGKNIVETAKADKQFSTFVSLLNKADLTSALEGAGPFTVFAPTDDAFKKLDPKTLEDLEKPENKSKLQGILKYHVHQGKMMADAVKAAKSIKTMNGAELTVTVKEGKVMVDTSTVTKADVACSNGVIHVIDTVAMPKADGHKADSHKKEDKKDDKKKSGH